MQLNVPETSGSVFRSWAGRTSPRRSGQNRAFPSWAGESCALIERRTPPPAPTPYYEYSSSR